MATSTARFRILETLGHGGMGTVYLAVLVGEGGFEKRVALKKLKPELSRDPESIELFMREARLAAQLCHPNIVQVFDGGLDEGNLYLVLEYVDGGDLEGRIRAFRALGRPPHPDAIAHVGAQLCEALCCLFELRDDTGQALVQAHRDISPSNVLIARNGVVKLSDFGVVRLRESKTAVGRVRGKWEYFPPELVKGQHDQRGDLFALGITLYKLAALEHPFAAETPPKHFERACREQPAPIPGLPAPLWEIIARALSKDPRDRFQTAEEMGAAFDALVTASRGRVSPRYLARDLFSPELPRPAPELEPATLLATELGHTDTHAARSSADAVSQEVSRFEAMFGPQPGAAPEPPASMLIDGPLTGPMLQALFEAYVAHHRRHRGAAPTVTRERLAAVLEARLAELRAQRPDHPVRASVVLQGGRVTLRLQSVAARAAARP